jgi:hypothetical protein
MKQSLWIITVAWLISGCSVYKVLSQADPANLDGIGIGSPRQILISQLGPPRLVDTDKHGNKQDYFEFESGKTDAERFRALFYLGADVVTLSLAELIFWPIEMTALESDKCVATATYDSELRVTEWNVSLKKGGVCN